MAGNRASDGGIRGILIVATGVVLLALIAGLVLIQRGDDGDRTTVVADFERTISLYEGADVRILGVPVGTVDEIEPMGTSVRVTMSYDSEHRIAADARALVVTPSIVGDRYVQLTPALPEGSDEPALADGDVLDTDSTATPVELDEVYSSLDDLAVALGPEGANRNGALSGLLETSAEGLDGQGRKINRMLTNFSKLTTTLDDNSGELFGSVRQLNRFVRALALNDGIVREFNGSLAEVADVLEGERGDLAEALDSLAGSLTDVRDFVQDNRGALRTNVDALVDVTDQLVEQRDNLAELIDVSPTALSNLVAAYNPSNGTFDARVNVQGQNDSLEESFYTQGPQIKGAFGIPVLATTPCFLLDSSAECLALLDPLNRGLIDLPLQRTPLGGGPGTSEAATRTPSALATMMGVS